MIHRPTGYEPVTLPTAPPRFPTRQSSHIRNINTFTKTKRKQKENKENDLSVCGVGFNLSFSSLVLQTIEQIHLEEIQTHP